MYQVDAFSNKPFAGNPAAVCILDNWPDDQLLQNIARENNLAETAYIVPSGDDFQLRWFSPEGEMDLCGHATLASAHVIFTYINPCKTEIGFHSQSGKLTVNRQNNLIAMTFPARPPQPTLYQEIFSKAFPEKPLEILKSRDLLVVFAEEKTVAEFQPDFSLLKQITGCFAIIITAKGRQCDFVSRFFIPNSVIPEDPVTGSAHCTLIPYWAEKLGKTSLYARQLSARGGELFCQNFDDQVIISGHACTFFSGQIHLPSK
jgi:PhzF family phenazine biosynthesis protein